jgi:serine/threonine protein kinase
LESCSLFEVVSANPVWWISTVKAKTVARIVLALRFAHSLGLVYEHLTGNNILFDSDHCIQIVDFHPIVVQVGEMDSEDGTQLVGISERRWTPEKDIQPFGSILFELVLGGSPHGEASIHAGIPGFVSKIIKLGLSPMSGKCYSFSSILAILKQNNFQIGDGVDSAEVLAFVKWVESAE